jgi:hypothetical protein
VRQAEATEDPAGFRVLIARERQEDVLRPDVGSAELSCLVVGRKDRSLRIGGERRRHVHRLAAIGLVLDLSGHRLRVGTRLFEDVDDDLVGERTEQEVIRVEVEDPPFRGGLGGPLEKFARRVAEQPGHLHLLDRP